MEPLPQIVVDRATEFDGHGRKLEIALGAYCIGQLYGWRALCMFHSQSTLREYEKTLGVAYSEVCPEYTSLSRKVMGIRLADRLGAFWKVVKGPAYKSRRSNIEGGHDSQGSLL